MCVAPAPFKTPADAMLLLLLSIPMVQLNSLASTNVSSSVQISTLFISLNTIPFPGECYTRNGCSVPQQLQEENDQYTSVLNLIADFKRDIKEEV